MKSFADLSLVTKIAIPAVLLTGVTVGLVGLSKAGLDTLDANAHLMVDTYAARANLLLQANVQVSEASIQEKNLILDRDAEARAAYVRRYEEAKAAARTHAGGLVALSDTPERRAVNEGIVAKIEALFSATDQSVAATTSGAYAEAERITTGEGRKARTAVRDALFERLRVSAADLQAAKEASDAAAASTTRNLVLCAALVSPARSPCSRASS